MNTQPRMTQCLVYPVFGQAPELLAKILQDDVNIVILQRQLPAHIVDFSAALLSLDEPLAEAFSLEMADEKSVPNLNGLASGFSDAGL